MQAPTDALTWWYALTSLRGFSNTFIFLRNEKENHQ